DATVGLTAPLGSTKGLVVGGDGLTTGVVGFTPPIGSNKGSILSRDELLQAFASDGFGTTGSVEVAAFLGQQASAQGNSAILIGLRASTPQGGNTSALQMQGEAPTQGIIAILIGLRTPTEPSGPVSTGFFHILPYIEQENLFKQY